MSSPHDCEHCHDYSRRCEDCGYCAHHGCEHCRHCSHHCCDREPTTTELIARRDWKALDERFGLLEHGGQTVILYVMIKALLEHEPRNGETG